MLIDPTPLEALTTAVDLLGGQSAMARLCGVTQGAVFRWLNVAGRLPAEHVLRVEVATKVSRHHLRLDIYPVEMIVSRQVRTAVDLALGRINYVDSRCNDGDNNAPDLSDAARDPTQPRRPPGR